ncbi:MAG: Mth938-like domain-containing protein [Gallionella sp.]
MKLHLANLGDTKMFTAHDVSSVFVNRVAFSHPIVVNASEVREDWQVAHFDTLDENHFKYFLAFAPEIVIIGTGAKQRFAHPKLYRALTDKGIGVEFMDTPAACRTYNILVAEDRKVIAAIMP